MADRLREYERKRDLAGTPEPPAAGAREQGGDAQSGEGTRFVVQEHSATRLHWDLRLEHEGTLASWAIPNGIPRDPEENRKAVRTEGHPLEYLDFHGEIPAGHYGAGTMTIWDRGTYECHEFEDGKVVATFHGERVQGRYALFRAGRDPKDWMIHRMDPPEPGREPMPERIDPMLATPGPLPDPEDGWAYEIAWGGVRAIAHCPPGRLRLQTADLGDAAARYPELRRLTRAIGAREAVLDGEVVAFDEDGRPSAERLEHRAQKASESTIRRRMKSHPVTYVIFDMLHLDGRVLLDLTYGERRTLLEGLDLGGAAWQTPANHAGGGAALLDAASGQGLGGLVAKRVASRYEPGRRAGDWVAVEGASLR